MATTMLPEIPTLGGPSVDERLATLFRGQLALHALVEMQNERITALEEMVVYEGEADDTSGSE